ncbi:unnamed protein product [Symbiodinium sp. CCMP2456]|nr:unnamed protein product [Symbiodinium sp. CCMP2456]
MAATSSNSRPQGADVSITDTLKGYCATPRLHSGRRMGVVLVAGSEAIEVRHAAEHLASCGFSGIVPDFAGQIDSGASTGSSSEKDWLLEALLPEVEASVAFLRRQGCNRFGLVGFGPRGGRLAEAASGLGHFAASVSVQGTGHSRSTYAEAQCGMLYIVSEDGCSTDAAVLSELAAAGAATKVLQAAEFQTQLLELLADTFSKACLRKATFVKVGTLHPDAKGLNVLLKVLEEPRLAVKTASGSIFEVRCGDETAQVVLSLQEEQLQGIEPDKVLAARNASIRMVQGFMRLAVDKWGKLDLEVAGKIDEVGKKNLSEIQYELMRP